MSLNSLGPSNGMPNSRMTHSLSTPSGVDGSTSAAHHSRGGKKLTVRVQMLDDSMTMFQVQAKALGKVLFEQVCRQLNLLEADYFGLEYLECSTGTKYWLDLEKALNRQVGFSLVDPMLKFCVKFYAPDPAQLEEEYTRYLFCLQVKRDLSTGSLQCNDNTAALMASYIVQASCGDYSYEDYPDHTYLSSYRFVPQQDHAMQRRIMENHKKHVGQSPAEADLNLLETARRCELYGMKMHAAKDHEGVPLNLAVAHMGLAVFQGITRINTFSWAKIRKISFKRKKLLIKLHPEGYGYYKDIVEFFFEGRNECKNFWKKCVENHGFFRCQAVQSIPRRKTRVLSRGSSFRYSGKTQKQIIEFVRDNYVKRQTFQRSQSFRQGPLHTSKRSQSQNAVSISAHPLLPIETADWEARNQNLESKMPSQMKKEADMESHQQEALTPYSRPVTAAQVEIYQMTKNSQLEDHRRPSQQMDSSLSVSPTATTPQRNIINNVHEAGRVLVLPEDRNLVNSARNLHYATIPKYTQANNSSITHYQRLQLSGDPNSSTVETEASSTSHESITLHQDTSRRFIPDQSTGHNVTLARYNNTSTCSMSNMSNKFDVSTATDLSDDDDIDNIIYSDINDLHKLQQQFNTQTIQTQTSSDLNNYEREELEEDEDDDDEILPYVSRISLQKMTARQPLIINNNDLYATVDRKAKTKAIKPLLTTDDGGIDFDSTNGMTVSDRKNEIAKNYSSEFIDNSIRNINNVLNSIENYQYQASLNYDEGSMPDYLKDDGSSFRSNFNSHSDHYLSYANSNSHVIRNTNASNLPRNSEMSGVESVDSYDSHYITHNPGNSENNSTLHYASIMKPENSTTYYEQANQTKSCADRLEYDIANTSMYTTLQYNDKTYEEDSDDIETKESWQRSASCRELYDFGYDYKKLEYGCMMNEREFITTDRIDSPITRYDDDFRRSNYETNRKYSVDLNEDFHLPETKVYSSSYPGTTYNTIDQNLKRGTYSQYEFNGSQDLSHDSYELLEKSDDDFYYKFKHNTVDHHARSCSLDSGNFIPTDYESDEEKIDYVKYRSGLDIKSRSAADIMNDVFLLDDPRDLPKEKLCVKSDGSFYKHVKEAMGIRTSSQESHSEFYESKISKSSSSSKKSKDSVYHTDSKKSRETLKSKSGSDYNPSSPEEMFLVGELLNRNNYEMPTTTAKKTKNLKKMFENNSRRSSQDSKSEYYDTKVADQSFNDEDKIVNQIVSSHDNLASENVQASYDSQVHFSTFPSNHKHSTKTSNVQSISLQNVEIERNVKTYSAYKTSNQNTPTSCTKPNTIDGFATKKTHIWPEEIEGLQTEITGIERAKNYRKRSDGEANIFSFDKEKIESLTSSQSNENIECEKPKKSPDYPLTPELLSEFDKQKIESPNVKPKLATRKEELMAKTHFEEYNPKLMIDPKIQMPVIMPYPHATVERTKSDPNSLANRPRLTVNSRRHTLMHQKSIDLTPADSSEDEYLYKQIPSAPPVFRNHGTHFELPKSYDPYLGQIDINIPMTGFEMPQNFFKEYEKRLQNSQFKDDIPYVLHKRHIMNGTAPSPNRFTKPKSPKSPKSPKLDKITVAAAVVEQKSTVQDFLFTKDTDLSKVNIETLEEKEKNKKSTNLSSPKRDITKRLDPKVLETLNSKLSQIESDSATSSKTDSAHRVIQKREFVVVHKIDPSIIKKEAILSGKRAVKPRSAQNKTKNNLKSRSKAKTRITSFSSDDESIDSDDVFGSAEAMPTKMEFSPPQSRKEIEPILKHEHSKISQAAWARGQTMSSTEVEGSPPQCRKLADLESRYHTHKLDTNFMTSSELRRISERSISIPSSEDGDGDGQSTLKCELATEIYRTTENLAEIDDNEEQLKLEDDDDSKFKTLPKKETAPKSKAKIIEELIESSMIIRSKGHVPVLFAHARLNLSEGSAFASLQRQSACNDSPTRRAKSLDAPVISLHRLPPMNAFSSKDDTVEFEEEAETLEIKRLDKTIDEECEDYLVCTKSLSPMESRSSICEQPIIIEDDELELLNRLKFIEKITLQGVKIKEKRKSRTQLRSGDQLILEIPKYKFEPFSSGNSSLKTSPAVSRASSVESRSNRKQNDCGNLLQSSPTNLSKKPPTKPDRADSKKSGKALDIRKSGDKLKVPMDTLNKSGKERSKSLEKMDPKNSSSKGRKSITEETELEKAKRKERQQKLYESAMKQTINMLSPVKDQLPPFPPVEDKISVKKDGDKIVIDTDIKSKPEDCVLIAKYPRKLDSQLAKYSRSCEESKSIEKIDKANRSFEDRNKSEFEDSEKSDNPENTLSTTQCKTHPTKEEIKAQIEGTVVHKKIQGKSRSLEKKPEVPFAEARNKTKSLDNYFDAIEPKFKQEISKQKNVKAEANRSLKYDTTNTDRTEKLKKEDRIVIKSSSMDANRVLKSEKQQAMDRRATSQPDNYDEDMQAIISERRNLDLMKRHTKASDNDEKEASESSLTTVTDVNLDDANMYFFSRIPTIECEEPSIEEDHEEVECEKSVPLLDRQNTLEKSRGGESTFETDEFVGIDNSDNDNKIQEQDDTEKPSGSDDLSDLTKCTDEKTKQEQLLYHVQAASRRSFLKLNIEKSRSSDTGSSMDKDGVPMVGERKDSSASFSNKEKSSMEEESSLSCSIAKPLGISQDFVDQNDQIRCKQLRDAMLRLEGIDKVQKLSKKMSPTLEKQLPIDLGSGSELDSTDPIEEKISKLLRFDESDSGSDAKPPIPKIQKPPRDLSLSKKVTRAIPIEDLSQPPEQLQAKLNSAHKYLNATNSGSSMESSAESKRSLSAESKESFETESSSGSLGKAQRKGDLSQRQMQTTWKSFPIESSGSSNEENWQPDHDSYEKFEVVESLSDNVGDEQKESDSDFQDELNEFPSSFNYPEGSSSLSVNTNPVDIMGYGTGFAIGRTLSRISERSTNSDKSSIEEEKTSIDDDITAHEDIEEEEEQSVASSDHQASMSSDIHSNSHQAYISDTDRRTSAEMPDIPCDSAAAERLADLYKSKLKKTAKRSVENVLNKDKLKAELLAGSGSSQESEDWPLPEIPVETPTYNECYNVFTMSDKPVPKMFMWRNSIAGTHSQESDAWPSPPSSVIETPVIEDVHTFYISEPQNPQQVTVESFNETQNDDDDEGDYAEVADIAPDPPRKDYELSEPVSPSIASTTSPTVSIILPYEDAAYFMADDSKTLRDETKCFESQLTSVGCFKSTLRICSINKSLSGPSQARMSSPDKVIITQPARGSSSLQSPLSEDEFFMADEVFSPGTVKIEISPDDGRLSDFGMQKFSRSSNNSDTSIDDMLSASLSLSTYMDDSQRRSSLEPGRLSSGSCKKCSGGSHSEEETSSFGTDLDGTVKMGVPAKKCTHSSHSEDTSIGVSLSEWSTGTNTVRQYANLSGSDSLSAVSNHSGGIKSEKSNTTKSSISSINKSTESLNEKSMSLSCGKNIPYSFENLSKDANSDTDKITSSGTNDESTLTLTEMVHSITEWSTSSSQTLVEHDVIKPVQQMDFKYIDKSKTLIEYTPLKPAKTLKRVSSIEKENDSIPGIHTGVVKSKADTIVTQTVNKSTLSRLPKIVDMIEKPNISSKPKIPPPPVDDSETGDSNGSKSNNPDRHKTLKMMSQQYKSQDVSESESYSDKLYNKNEKLSERYQSQEFSPFTIPLKPPRESKAQERTLSKHHSYDDKTLSKSQIREYKSAKVRQSQSFHEHLLSSDLNKIEEEKLSSSTTTHTSETSTENSSPMFARPDKLAKCSPYYSSSLSSDTPEVHQVIQKPPRRPSIPKTLPSQSSNDTDSSLDFRQNDPVRNRGYRKKKQIPSTKRIRMDHETEYQESSECSEGYFPDIHSSSSDNAKGGNKYPDFEEEPEVIPDDFDDCNYKMDNSKVGSYPSTSRSTKFETLDLSENVDEMGFPRYDRLRNMTNPPMFKPPTKPVRQKKKIQGKNDKPDINYAGVHYGQDSGSGTETKAGLSDDVYYSSEDSFAAAFINQKHQSAGHYVNVELPYPDFLSDYEKSQGTSYQKNNDSEKSFDSDEDDISDYHGINGNVSLDRRSEIVQSANRYDLSLGSEKSSSSRNGVTYDIVEAERNNQQNIINNNTMVSTPTSIGSTQTNGNSGTMEKNGDAYKKKWPSDKAYFLSKEILMTERTYKRDLDVINSRFRKMLGPEDVENLQPLFEYFESMVQHHSIFLRDLEHRIVVWESRGEETHRIGDVMLKNMVVLPIYEEYIEVHRENLQRLNDLFTSDDRFQQIYKEFEQEKVCYLPVCFLLLKPLHRLLQYQMLMELLLNYYSDENMDKTDVQGALVMLSRTNELIRQTIAESENFVLLCEIQRDLSGFDSLVQDERKLIRQGCLLKHSRRGLQQRMFFLFTDVLIYASKPQFLQTFKVLGHVPVRSLLTENSEHNAFVIFGGGISITVSAGATFEKNLWMDELQKAAANLKYITPQLQPGFTGMKCCTSSEEGLEMCGLNVMSPSSLKAPTSRNNTALHVCWHRGVTVSLEDHIKSSENQISGYLLRKFKNSSGWQKLWVVLTQFCLFFYKSYQDEIPLASLPLLGYSVGPPGAQDAVQKDFVFKLSFKNHTYFFRAESEISYERWLDNLKGICNQKYIRS